MSTTLLNQNTALVSIPHGMKCTIVMAATSTALVQRIREEVVLETVSVIASETRIFGEYYTDILLKISCLTGSLTYVVEQSTSDSVDLSYHVPTSHPLSFEGLKLASNTNVIRGASVNPTRTSGWISFSGTIGATPAQCYTDYRELHTTGVAEVLGIGSFPYMDATASCASMFAGQDIAFVSTGATVLSAAAAPSVGIFARSMKVTLDTPTFTAGGCAAVNFKSFQANVTDVSAEETSIDDIEVASGQINTIWRIRKTAGAIARSLIHFDAATVAPIIQDPTLFHDPNAVTCDKGLHVQIGSVSYMIPLYASDTGAVVANW